MLSFVIGFAGSIIGVVGWFAFDSILALVVGLITYVIETIMEWNLLNANAKKIDVAIIAAGCIIGIIVNSAPFYVMGLLFLNIYSLIVGIVGLILALLKRPFR